MKIGLKYLTLLVLAGGLLGMPALAQNSEEISGGDQTEVALGASAVTVAVADKGDGHGEMHGACRGGGCGMDLTDDQLEKMNALKLAYTAATAAQRAELRVLHSQLQDMLTRPAVDRSAAIALQTKINAIHDDLAIKRINYKLDNAAVLTDEQRHERRHRMLMHRLLGQHCGHGHH